MGYCAKGIMFKSVYWTLMSIFIGALNVRCIAIPGKTSPGMRTYDIWGSAPRIDPFQSDQNTVTANTDALLQDYSQKTSLRHGKGSLTFLPIKLNNIEFSNFRIKFNFSQTLCSSQLFPRAEWRRMQNRRRKTVGRVYECLRLPSQRWHIERSMRFRIWRLLCV